MSRLRLIRGRTRYRPGSNLAAPLPPSSLTATVLSSTSIKLDWLDNSSNELGFSVEQDSVEINVTAPNVTSYTVTGLTPGTTYSFRVRAFTTGPLYSNYSNTATDHPSFQYGYPAFTANGTEPNVVAQWLFDEAATNNLVDTVSGTTLTRYGVGAEQVPAGHYQTAALSAVYDGLSYGIDHDWDDYGTPRAYQFAKLTSTASCAPGTGDFTKEFWLKMTSEYTTSARYLFSTSDGEGGGSISAGDILFFTWSGAQLRLFYQAYTTDATELDGTVNIASINDNLMHHIRLRFQRSGNLTIYIDGASQGTLNISALSGKTIDNVTLRTGQFNGGTSSVPGVLYEVRLSNNSTNNSYA